MLKDNCPDTGCGIKAYHRDAFLRLPFFTSMHRYLPALFQTYGLEVAYEPVNDRPRHAGQSKYSNFGRALVGIYDLFGVTWLRRRTLVPKVTERGSRSRNEQLSRLVWWANVSTVELIWLTVGFLAQALFSMRFIIQWIASERVKRSIVPEAFWYFSLAEARCCSPTPSIASIPSSCSAKPWASSSTSATSSSSATASARIGRAGRARGRREPAVLALGPEVSRQ